MIAYRLSKPTKEPIFSLDKPEKSNKVFKKSIGIFNQPSSTQQTFKIPFGFLIIHMVFQKTLINQFFSVCRVYVCCMEDGVYIHGLLYGGWVYGCVHGFLYVNFISLKWITLDL